MKRLSRLVFAVLALVLSISLASRAAPAAGPTPGNTFPREPVVVYTSQLGIGTQTASSTLVLYRDGFVSVSRSDGSGRAPVVAAGDVGAVKARSWFRALVLAGAATLPDGPTPDPAVGGASTLTLFEPGTNSTAHTFSFGSGDYPDVQRAIDAIFLRLGV